MQWAEFCTAGFSHLTHQIRWFSDPCTAFYACPLHLGIESLGNRLEKASTFKRGRNSFVVIEQTFGLSHLIQADHTDSCRCEGKRQPSVKCATQWRLTQPHWVFIVACASIFLLLKIVQYFFRFLATSKSWIYIPPLSLQRTPIGLLKRLRRRTSDISDVKF